jgi:catechol 2,3-dioxygenase-like lactoylglutathione lyase family enzyme
MPVTGFDHAAVPTANAIRFLEFYKKLGFGIEGEDALRSGAAPFFSITFGDNKINVHSEKLVERRGSAEYLRGPTAEPGCGDFCFVWSGGMQALLTHLESIGVDVIEGPVARIGGRAEGTAQGVSVYIRDPDDNLLEFMSYDPEDVAQHERPAY